MLSIVLKIGLALAILVSLTSAARLSPELHRELLLSGPPKIGLWQALLKQENARLEAAQL